MSVSIFTLSHLNHCTYSNEIGYRVNYFSCDKELKGLKRYKLRFGNGEQYLVMLVTQQGTTPVGS